MSKTIIIAVANQKGGVGKTTTTRELGFYLHFLGFNVLFIDCDQQGNLTKGVYNDDTKGLYDAMTGTDYRIIHVDDKLFLLPGESRLASLEKSLLAEVDVYTRMKDTFLDLKEDYDFILIDCPPSLGVLTINSLVFADYVIVPVYPALYSLQGTNDLLETIRKVQINYNQDLKFLGFNVNRYDPRALITRAIVQELTNSFGDKVFASKLIGSTKIVEEAINCQCGIVQMRKSKIKDQVIALGREVLNRLGVANEQNT
ncbi:MAG: ParA family protein [Spirochaetes bacterium]|nr:ParA family protein [Spirochaetota bacterium]